MWVEAEAADFGCSLPWAGGGVTPLDVNVEGAELGPSTWTHEDRVFCTDRKYSKHQGFLVNAVSMLGGTCVSVFCTLCVCGCVQNNLIFIVSEFKRVHRTDHCGLSNAIIASSEHLGKTKAGFFVPKVSVWTLKSWSTVLTVMHFETRLSLFHLNYTALGKS